MLTGAPIQPAGRSLWPGDSAHDTRHRRCARSARLSDLLPALLAEAGPNGTALLGVDFPIGLPQGYATKAGISDFCAGLKKFGRGRWRSFDDPLPQRAPRSL